MERYGLNQVTATCFVPTFTPGCLAELTIQSVVHTALAGEEEKARSRCRRTFKTNQKVLANPWDRQNIQKKVHLVVDRKPNSKSPPGRLKIVGGLL